MATPAAVRARRSAGEDAAARGPARPRGCGPERRAPASGRARVDPGRRRVWLFDLDNTLHDASHSAFGPTSLAMNAYMVGHLGLAADEAARLRQRYWERYGATLLGLVRHHGVDAGHFLDLTHRHPGLEQRLRGSAHDRAALERLRGRKFVVTNAPRRYTERVLATLGLARCFDGVISIEDMSMFGQLRPKPDARMLRRLVARLRVRACDCVLVEDVLENQKSARRVGMRTAWMQRYLDGRFRGHVRLGPDAGRNDGMRRRGVGVHPCPAPHYVYAKIRSLRRLLTLG